LIKVGQTTKGTAPPRIKQQLGTAYPGLKGVQILLDEPEPARPKPARKPPPLMGPTWSDADRQRAARELYQQQPSRPSRYEPRAKTTNCVRTYVEIGAA
jgi:hypothetical protein